MTKQREDFLDSIDGALTPEQAAQLLSMDGEGDTLDRETGGKPDAAPELDDKAKAGAEADGEPDPANSVILAKDGVHTIPFDRLVEAREQAKAAKAAEEAARQELELLRAQAQQRADAGVAPTAGDNLAAAAEAAIDAGIDPDYFGDFSEEALAAGIRRLTAEQVQAEVQRHMAQALAPLQQKQQAEAQDAHYQAIYAAHPDADSLVESQELQDWINAQPAFARPGYAAVLSDGSTQDVIDLFTTFKESTGKAQQPAGDIHAKAKAAIDRAGAAVPNSLSDFPGGRTGATSRTEAMADMDGVQLMQAMTDMDKDQIEQYLNSL